MRWGVAELGRWSAKYPTTIEYFSAADSVGYSRPDWDYLVLSYLLFYLILSHLSSIGSDLYLLLLGRNEIRKIETRRLLLNTALSITIAINSANNWCVHPVKQSFGNATILTVIERNA